MAAAPLRTYRSASPLAAWLIVAGVASAVVSGITIPSLATRIEFLQDAQFDPKFEFPQVAWKVYLQPVPPLVVARDARLRFLGILDVASHLLFTMVFLTWIYRANSNARALGAQGMEYTPGWSVGTFFVPVANLFLPYAIVGEIWQGSTPGTVVNWRRMRASPLLTAWWTVWFLHPMANNSWWPILTRNRGLADIYRNPGWRDTLWDDSWQLLVGEFVGIASLVLTVVIVVNITGLQERSETVRVADENPPSERTASG